MPAGVVRRRKLSLQPDTGEVRGEGKMEKYEWSKEKVEKVLTEWSKEEVEEVEEKLADKKI